MNSFFEIRNFLVKRMSDITGLPADDIDVFAPVASLGIDSVHALELIEELERRTHVAIPDTLVWNFPNIDGIARHLADHGRSESNSVDNEEPA